MPFDALDRRQRASASRASPGMGFVFARKRGARALRRQLALAVAGPARPVASTWRRRRSGASRRRRTSSSRSPRRSSQFVDEGGQPARLARYTAQLRDAGRRHGGARLPPFLDPRSRRRSSSRSTRRPIRATQFKAFYDARARQRLHPLSGQADAGRDVSRRLHRRDRPARDAPGGQRGRRRAAGAGHRERRAGRKTSAERSESRR